MKCGQRMDKYIHCDNCGKAVVRGTKVWAYGSMRYCNGKCLVTAFREGMIEPDKQKKNESWTVLREKHLAEEGSKHDKQRRFSRQTNERSRA